MALKKPVTDEKGVTTNYHRIESFTYHDGEVEVTLATYVDEAQRQDEIEVEKHNVQVEKYEKDLAEKRDRLDQLSPQVGVVSPDNQELIQEIKQLSAEVNNLEMSPDKPRKKDKVDKRYKTLAVTVPYSEPLTLNSLYGQIMELDDYSGAELVDAVS